jgi:hypothetical protein
MQLPDDVLLIIREYSKPVTRPDWRTCCPLSGHVLYTCLNTDLRVLRHTQIIWETLVLYKRVFNYLINTHWGKVYMMTRLFGIQYSSIHFETTIQELYKMPGLMHAHEYYTRVSQFYDTLF